MAEGQLTLRQRNLLERSILTVEKAVRSYMASNHLTDCMYEDLRSTALLGIGQRIRRGWVKRQNQVYTHVRLVLIDAFRQSSRYDHKAKRPKAITTVRMSPTHQPTCTHRHDDVHVQDLLSIFPTTVQPLLIDYALNDMSVRELAVKYKMSQSSACRVIGQCRSYAAAHNR